MSTPEIWGALLMIIFFGFGCLAAALLEMCNAMPAEDDE